MSHNFYNSLWADAQQELRGLIQDEKKIIPGIEITDNIKLLEFLSELYIKYLHTFKKMDSVYDQVVHPQKRPLIRKLLDLLIIRLLEIRQALIDTEFSEFFYFDDFLQWMHWCPEDLEIQTPKYYLHERGPEFVERESWLEQEYSKKLAEEEATAEGMKMSEEDRLLSGLPGFVGLTAEYEDDIGMGMSLERAIRFIQIAERARQGRARFEMARYIFEEEERAKGRRKRQKQQFMDPNAAAVIIQRLVRRFIAYRRVQRFRNDELEFLGLSFNPYKTDTPMGKVIAQAKEWRLRIETHAEKRREVQRMNRDSYAHAQQVIESRVRLLEAPEMAETLKSNLRTWLIQVKDKTGKFPELPKLDMGRGGRSLLSPDKAFDDGQSVAMSRSDRGQSVPPGTSEDSGVALSTSKKDTAANKSGKKSPKDKKGGKKGGKKSQGSKSKSSSIGGGGLEPSTQLQQAIEANQDYNMNWRHRNENHNPDQRHEDELIIGVKREIISHEVRVQVDLIMKSELALLKEALLRKKGKKAKKAKKASGKRGSGKKGKKKKKKFKDLTPDRTPESLFTEMVHFGIIKKYPQVRFQDLVGERSIVNGTIRRFHMAIGGDSAILEEMANISSNFPQNPHPPPSFGDIKRVVREVCVLPMGSLTVHQIAPYTRSLLITGPEGSGKKSLVHAVCTELGATLFDLTPANVAGKYPGKPGLIMLMHLIAKVGRFAAPTVILIDECDKTYQKRVPKTDRTEPKRLKKPLVKFLKSIGPEDQIIIIGLSSEPWIAPIKMLKKDFQKIIYVPKPDHGDRLTMWNHVLASHLDQLHGDVNMTLLAKLSDGWSLGAIGLCTSNVTWKHYQSIAEERRMQERARAASVKSKSSAGSGLGGRVSNNEGSGRGGGASSSKISKIGRKLIRMDDFLRELSQLDPLFFEQEKLWNNWFSKTPLMKTRLAIAEAREEANEVKNKSKPSKASKA